MELIDIFLNIFANQDLLFRIGLIVLMSLYILFALILALQVRNLNRIVNQISFSPIFSFLGILHLTAAVGLLLFTVLFL